jgi:hypothetical protein
MAPRSEILCLAWLDPYHGLQWEDAKLSMMMEQLDLPLGNSKSSSCSLLLLAPYGKGERAPPSSNPYLLWMRASRWSPWPSLAAFQASIPSPFSSFPFPLLAWVWEHRERWTRERMGVQEWVNDEWVSWWVLCLGHLRSWTGVHLGGARWTLKVTHHISVRDDSIGCSVVMTDCTVVSVY